MISVSLRSERIVGLLTLGLSAVLCRLHYLSASPSCRLPPLTGRVGRIGSRRFVSAYQKNNQRHHLIHIDTHIPHAITSLPQSLPTLSPTPRKQINKHTHLQNLQLPQPLLHQLLYAPLIRLCRMVAKSISGPALRILAEIVRGKLPRLAEEGAVEGAHFQCCCAGGGGHQLLRMGGGVGCVGIDCQGVSMWCGGSWEWSDRGGLIVLVLGVENIGGSLCHL